MEQKKVSGMKGKVEPVLILYDSEEEYTLLMSDYLRNNKELPWKMRSYTRKDDLLMNEDKREITVLLVAESDMDDDLLSLHAKRMVVLHEAGILRREDIFCIDKYQPAEFVLQRLLEIFVDETGGQLSSIHGCTQAKCIGLFTPIRRTMQSTIALTMAQILAEKHKTLYLNFEHYAGRPDLLAQMQEKDLADVLYFMSADRDKFRLRFQTVLRKRGKLFYVPAMKAGQNMLEITPADWLSLLQKIDELDEFTYIVLDLTESMQGLYDILRRCKWVYTLVRDDAIAQAKLSQYEQALSWYDYDDVVEKTLKCTAPVIHKIPDDIEQLTKGELANFVRKNMTDVLRE